MKRSNRSLQFRRVVRLSHFPACSPAGKPSEIRYCDKNHQNIPMLAIKINGALEKNTFVQPHVFFGANVVLKGLEQPGSDTEARLQA